MIAVLVGFLGILAAVFAHLLAVAIIGALAFCVWIGAKAIYEVLKERGSEQTAEEV